MNECTKLLKGKMPEEDYFLGQADGTFNCWHCDLYFIQGWQPSGFCTIQSEGKCLNFYNCYPDNFLISIDLSFLSWFG